MDTRNAYKQKMEAQLKEWSAQINLFEAKAGNIRADMRVKYAETLLELRTKQHAASEKLKDLEKAGSEAWNQVKTTADKMWDDLKNGIADAHSKFK